MDSTGEAVWSPRRVIAAVLAVLAMALAVLGQVIGDNAVPADNITLIAPIAVLFTAMGALVLVGVPGHPVGRLMAAAGVTSLIAVLAASWSQWSALAWLSQWLWLPPLGLIVGSLLVFPNGKLPSRRWVPLAALIGLATAAATVLLAVAALEHPDTLLVGEAADRSDRAQALVVAARALIAGAGLLSVVGVVGSLWVRWRRAGGEARQQLMCLLVAGLVFLLALILDARDIPGGFLLAAVAMPVAMTIAVLKYRLYELDRIINRTAVWLMMTVLVIVGFVGLVTILRDVLTGGSSSHASLVATGLIAVTFEPVRRRVQRGVNQMLYGERDDPYKVIGRLGDLLGYTLDPRDILPLLTETIVRSLRVPYVAVELPEPDGRTAARRARHADHRDRRASTWSPTASGSAGCWWPPAAWTAGSPRTSAGCWRTWRRARRGGRRGHPAHPRSGGLPQPADRRPGEGAAHGCGVTCTTGSRPR